MRGILDLDLDRGGNFVLLGGVLACIDMRCVLYEVSGVGDTSFRRQIRGSEFGFDLLGAMTFVSAFCRDTMFYCAAFDRSTLCFVDGGVSLNCIEMSSLQLQSDHS